ncbi:MAG: MFS transporter [Acetobacteraceae bacterium]|nr:MFS transporter [Acetobacteraceae bacterium]
MLHAAAVQSRESPAPVARPTGRYRWLICALLFAITTINYMDRQVIGVLKPVIQKDIGFSEIDYGNIVFFFQLAYAAGYVGMGCFVDWVGVRIGLAVAVVIWSLSAAAHGLAASVAGFAAARFALGIGEGGNFPACIKTVATWFPVRDRAFATGVFNSGSNVGALITPIAVPWLTLVWGWPTAFYVTGLIGFVWLVFWLAMYRQPEEHPKLSAEELAYIKHDPEIPTKKVPWLQLLRYRGTWAFVVGTFLTSPVWWFYLFWVPDFLYKTHGLNLTNLGPPLVVIYLMTDVGSIAGGWLSSALIKRGFGVLTARKLTLLVCALCVLPVFLAPRVADLWLATIIIGLAASAHQGFSANLFTVVSDTMPRDSVSSVVGLGGMAGAIGGMFVAQAAGYVLQYTGSYVPLFTAAAGAYLLAILLMHLILPRHRSELIPRAMPAQ